MAPLLGPTYGRLLARPASAASSARMKTPDGGRVELKQGSEATVGEGGRSRDLNEFEDSIDDALHAATLPIAKNGVAQHCARLRETS